MLLDLIKYYHRFSKAYKSNSQITRVVTEKWFIENMYCPSCAKYEFQKYPSSKPVLDFYCNNCYQNFQLKSKRNLLGKRILDGEYNTIMNFIKNNRIPNFIFLIYKKVSWKLLDLIFVPKYFITRSIIEKRRPLTTTARRRGWVGCNILFNSIPDLGKIYVVKNEKLISKNEVLSSWNNIKFMNELKSHQLRSWTSDMILCVESFNKEIFNLDQCYSYEEYLKKLHPENKHIRPKIRQQLQILRDKGLIKFLGRGRYQKII